MADTSTKPYLLRALYEWCTDHGYTPYIAVVVDSGTRVPMEFVKNGEIVLNISFEATGNLKMENDLIHFKARFGGVAREIEVPVANVSAIYARENGQGMSFEVDRGVDLTLSKKNKVDDKAGERKRSTKLAAALSSVPTVGASVAGADETQPSNPEPDPDPNKPNGRPRLTRIK
jgi:stringent starvation protein B